MPDPLSGFFSGQHGETAAVDILVERGWIPSRLVVKVYARTTVTEGYVYQLDMAGADAAVTAGSQPGTSDSPFANIVATTTVAHKTAHAGISCIATEDIADDAQGRGMLRGFYPGAQVESTVAAGHGLSAESNGKFHESSSSSRKLVGVAMTAYDSGTATVYFDGINGVGSVR